MNSIVCRSEMQPSYRLILLYFSEVKKYHGSSTELAQIIALSGKTITKALKYLSDEGFLSYERAKHPTQKHSNNGIQVRYLDHD